MVDTSKISAAEVTTAFFTLLTKMSSAAVSQAPSGSA